MPDTTLDHILDALDDARQRATYGAVASLLGRTPRSLMRGRTRDRRHSWVVNRTSGKPTGYADDELHPDLQRNEHLIDTALELERWLASAVSAPAASAPAA
jgi:hypothetical protein